MQKKTSSYYYKFSIQVYKKGKQHLEDRVACLPWTLGDKVGGQGGAAQKKVYFWTLNMSKIFAKKRKGVK